MAAVLQGIEDLRNWNAYRDFLKERLKQVPDGETEFYVSKEKFDFDLQGKPWSGRVILVGPKGLMMVQKLKKEGLLFREGTCRSDGKGFQVEGIPAKLVKDADKTLAKLMLGYRASAVGGEDGDGEDDEGELPTATVAGMDLAGRWKELKSRLTPQIRVALAESPELKQKIAALVNESVDREKAQDWAGAIKSFESLGGLIAAGARGAAKGGGDGAAYREGILVWDKALEAVQREIDRVKKSILDTYKGDPSQAQASKGVGKLEDLARKIDAGLSEKLKQAQQAKDPAQQAKLQQEVEGLLKKVAASLGKDPMIKSLDANPFLSVSIRQSAAAALKQVAASVRT